MKKLPPKILFQDIAPDHKGKVETLKIKIAAGEYRINPYNIAEKLMTTNRLFKIYKHNSPPRPWLFKPRSF
jgi:hypothetical protein